MPWKAQWHSSRSASRFSKGNNSGDDRKNIRRFSDMKVEDIKKVAVMGAGDMGHGIAEVALLAGYKVALRDIEQRFVDKGLSRINESLNKLVEKQKVTADNRKAMMANITTFVDIAEAVMDLKRQVFQALDAAAPKHAILASNTSNMSITEIAAATSRPGQVVGFHFFNPAVLMKLVEVTKGAKTSEETMQAAYNLALKMNKAPVRVEKDSIGFVYNRIQAPTAVLLDLIVERGDAKMRKMGMPMGPYEIMDYTGLDVAYHSALYFADKLSKDYTPPSWLKAKVDAGELGKKTGKGIFDWSKGRPEIDLSKAKEDFDPTLLIAIQVNEATKLLEGGVVKSAEEIDKAIVNGGGSAFGPFQLGKGIGYDKLAKICEDLAKKYGIKSFEPTRTLKEGRI
jgi:enoyl-CoA hydratase/3-hydroxyacyl-CoA dehydrogenase